MAEYNQQYFNKNDVKEGLHLKFIDFLLTNLETNDYRLDLHVYNEDCGAIVVEWVRPFWNDDYDMGSFKFVDGDQVVIPEDSIQYVEQAPKKRKRLLEGE